MIQVAVIQVVESTARSQAPYLITVVKRVYMDQPPGSSFRRGAPTQEVRPAVGLNAQWDADGNAEVFFSDGDVYVPGDLRNVGWQDLRNLDWQWSWRSASRPAFYYPDGRLIFQPFDLRKIGLAGYMLANQMMEVAIEAKAGRPEPRRKLMQLGEFWGNDHLWRLIVPIGAP